MTQPQHMNALALANEVRFARAALRRRVTAVHDYAEGRRELAAIIETEHELLASGERSTGMTIEDLLRWVWRMDRRSIDPLLEHVGASEYRRVRDLTAAQRRRLVEGLRSQASLHEQRHTRAERRAA